MATAKEKFVIDLLNHAKGIANTAMDESPNLDSQFFDNGWDSGGSDPIIDADLLNFNDLLAVDVDALIVLIQQLNNFFGNLAVVQADYAATLNTTRFSDFGG